MSTPNQPTLRAESDEQVLAFSGATPTSFSSDGGYFQFKDESECQKFIVWLKQLEATHAQAIQDAVALNDKEWKSTNELLTDCLFDSDLREAVKSSILKDKQKEIIKSFSQTEGVAEESK